MNTNANTQALARILLDLDVMGRADLDRFAAPSRAVGGDLDSATDEPGHDGSSRSGRRYADLNTDLLRMVEQLAKANGNTLHDVAEQRDKMVEQANVDAAAEIIRARAAAAR